MVRATVLPNNNVYLINNRYKIINNPKLTESKDYMYGQIILPRLQFAEKHIGKHIEISIRLIDEELKNGRTNPNQTTERPINYNGKRERQDNKDSRSTGTYYITGNNVK